MVQSHRQLYLADCLQEHRERLEEIVTELAERGEPISPLEARLMVDAGKVRLSQIEAVLRRDAYRRPRRVAGRFRAATRPCIGRLRHYDPKPLLVPATYFATRPPDPAPTLSIVTPSFQQGRFLERTLYSVVSQAYPALEYIVQDGGSSDETVEVLERFQQLLTSWRSEPDGGQADAINRGFAQTTGAIMAWLNSDDLLLPGTLAYVARYFEKHPDVDVVYGHRVMIDENDDQIGAWILPAHDDVVLSFADYVPQETLFWRRRIWDEVGGSVDSSFAYALDWDLLLRFREAGATMVRLPRFLGAFRIHDDQKSTAAHAVGLAECDGLRQRVHGRQVSNDEIHRRLRSYLRRHILIHKRHRILDRLPLRRRPVVTVPIEPGLRGPERKRPSIGLQDSTKATPSVSPVAPPPSLQDDPVRSSPTPPLRLETPRDVLDEQLSPLTAARE